jgi:signal transduction histidine kinase
MTTTLVVVAFAVPLGALVQSVARDRAISDAERDAAALAPVLAITGETGLIASAIDRTATGADHRLTVLLAPGTVVGDRTPLDADAVELARGKQLAFSQRSDGGLALYSPVLTGTGDVIVIRTRVPDRLLRDGVATSWAALAGVAAVLVLSAVVIADRLARSLTRDAAAVASTARSLAHGDATARVVPGPTPELADVGHGLNLLADRIDELRAAERERVADLSHRLRTPLTALRMDAESADNAAVVAGVDRLESAVTDLIHAARRPLHASPVGATADLVAVVRERAEFWSALAVDDGREWSLRVPEQATSVPVPHDDLEAAVDALVGNVFAHTPDGTTYSIVVARDGAFATVAVEDAGPGITDPQRALDRGVTSGGSSGLGLDIVRQVAEAADGSLTVGPSALGGARVAMSLRCDGAAGAAGDRLPRAAR